jgi:hypothetical protein
VLSLEKGLIAVQREVLSLKNGPITIQRKEKTNNSKKGEDWQQS